MPLILKSRQRVDLKYYDHETSSLRRGISEKIDLSPYWFGSGIDWSLPDTLAERERALNDGFHQAKSDRRKKRIYELVIPAPKWVSIAVVLGNEETQRLLLNAHRSAINAVISDLTTSLLWVSKREGNKRFYEAGAAFKAVEYVHMTSRSMDPHLHSHVLLSNSALDAEKVARAISELPIGYACDALELNYLRHLHADLHPLESSDVEVQMHESILDLRNGHPSFASVAKAIAATGNFSARSRQIQEYLDRNGYSSAKARSIASLLTREEKVAVRNLEELCELWRGRVVNEIDFKALATNNIYNFDRGFAGEIAKTSRRVDARANAFGLDMSLERRHGREIEQLTRVQSPNFVLPQNYILDEDLDNIANTPSLRSDESGSRRSYKNVPTMQRIYNVDNVRSVIHRLEGESMWAIGHYFQIGGGIEPVLALEDSLRSEDANGYFRLNSDLGIEVSSVGNQVYNALLPFDLAAGVPGGNCSVFVVSPLASPSEVDALLADNSARTNRIVVVDSHRFDNQTYQAIGRGANWRELLSQYSSAVVTQAHSLSLNVDVAPVLKLQISGTDARLFRSTSQMIASVIQMKDGYRDLTRIDGLPRGENLDSPVVVLADERLVKLVDGRSLSVESTLNSAFLTEAGALEHESIEERARFNSLSDRYPGEVLVLGLEQVRKVPDLFGVGLEIRDQYFNALESRTSVVGAVISDSGRHSMLVVDPISSSGSDLSDQLVVRRTLNSLGFLLDAGLVSRSTEDAKTNSTASTLEPIAWEMQLRELHEANLFALSHLSDQNSLRSSQPLGPQVTNRVPTIDQRLELNRRLYKIMLESTVFPGEEQDRNPNPGEIDVVARLEGMVKQLENQNHPNCEPPIGVSRQGDASRWLVSFSSRMLRQEVNERRERQYERGASPSLRFSFSASAETGLRVGNVRSEIDKSLERSL